MKIKGKDLNTLTIEDCINAYLEGNVIDIADGKVLSISKNLEIKLKD